MKFPTKHFPTLMGKAVIYLDKDEWLGLYPSQHLVNHESVIYFKKSNLVANMNTIWRHNYCFCGSAWSNSHMVRTHKADMPLLKGPQHHFNKGLKLLPSVLPHSTTRQTQIPESFFTFPKSKEESGESF